jgi:hypothetical protein
MVRWNCTGGVKEFSVRRLESDGRVLSFPTLVQRTHKDGAPQILFTLELKTLWIDDPTSDRKERGQIWGTYICE